MDFTKALQGAEELHEHNLADISEATHFQLSCSGDVCSRNSGKMTGPVFIDDAKYWTITAGFNGRPSRVVADYHILNGAAALHALLDIANGRPLFIETLELQKQFVSSEYDGAVLELSALRSEYEDDWSQIDIIENCDQTPGLEFIADHLNSVS